MSAMEDFREIALDAEDGDAEAQYLLGMAHRPDGGPAGELREDEEWAAYWLGKAAEQDHPKAQLEVGMLYLNGHGVEENEQTAAAWISVAANQGLAQAQYQIGMMLLGGIGVEINGEWAKYWFEQAGEQKGQAGSAALFRLGIMYETGQIVEKDKMQALFYYERSAELGNPQATQAAQAIPRQGPGPCAPGNTPGLPAAIRKELWGGNGW